MTGPTDDRASATDLLLRASAGEASDVAGIFPIVYDELRRLAHGYLAREAPVRTLGTTELVHEAYLRLIDASRVEWTGRAHFMGIAANAMRRILVDRARARRSLKRGGTRRPVPLDAIQLAAEDRADMVVSLDEALDRLRASGGGAGFRCRPGPTARRTGSGSSCDGTGRRWRRRW